MRINRFHKVKFMDEAYRLLKDDKENTIVSGGAWLKLSSKKINTAIDLSLLGLDKIVETDKYIEIGSMVTLRQIETNSALNFLYDGIIIKAIKNVMGIQLRNIATIGGTIAGRYGFSDLITPLLAVDAKLVFYNKGKISLQDFLKSKNYRKDILSKIIINKNESRGYFHTVKKTATDFSMLNIAISYGKDIKIAVGARPGVAMLAEKTMRYINKHNELSNKVFSHTVEEAVKEMKFSTNSRASKEYREELCRVFLKRGLEEVIGDES